jgi:hypothetical protein
MVRVRTFAALRHWLLNYFADDFAPSPSLRSQFVRLINSLGKDDRVKATLRDTRIIAELKRCWRRVCRIYWDDEVKLAVWTEKLPSAAMNRETQYQIIIMGYIVYQVLSCELRENGKNDRCVLEQVDLNRIYDADSRKLEELGR